jgi:hypothetical protein
MSRPLGQLCPKNHDPLEYGFRKNGERCCNACNRERNESLRRFRGIRKRHLNTISCTKGHLLNESNTYIVPSGLNKGDRTCKKCRRETTAECEYFKKYGETRQQKKERLKSQNNKCKICKTTNPGKRGWNTDHKPGTRVVRGILCLNCNNGLGRFKDNPETLRAAAKYLEDFMNLDTDTLERCNHYPEHVDEAPLKSTSHVFHSELNLGLENLTTENFESVESWPNDNPDLSGTMSYHSESKV